MPGARRGHRRAGDEAEIGGIEDLGGSEWARGAEAADQHHAAVGEEYGGMLGPGRKQGRIG